MISFAVLTVLLLFYLYYTFTLPTGRAGDCTRERFNTFYALEDNTVDCVFIGSSGTDRYWVPAVAWNDCGITSYELTSGDNHVIYTKYLMQEALNRHDVKVFAVDLRTFCRDLSEFEPKYIRRLTDSMHFSVNKLKMTHEVLAATEAAGCENIDYDDLSYYYAPIKYHSSWSEKTLEDMTTIFPKSDTMGYLGYPFIYNVLERDIPEPVFTEDVMPISEGNIAIIDDLLEYCEAHDFKVVFFSTPMSGKHDTLAQINYAEQYLEDRGYPVYDFNTEEMYETIGWNYLDDLYNKNHCNFRGALKFTHYMEDVFINEYNLEDHRNDPDQSRYQDWNDGFDNILGYLNQYNPEHYEQYTEEIGRN